MEQDFKEENARVVQKYERLLERLYVAYQDERKKGVIPREDSVIYSKIINGTRLVGEIKRQIAISPNP